MYPIKLRGQGLACISYTHLRDVDDQSLVELVDGVAVQLRGVGDELDQVGHRFVPHVVPCLGEWRSNRKHTLAHSINSIAGSSS